jgi:hypothetical protein
MSNNIQRIREFLVKYIAITERNPSSVRMPLGIAEISTKVHSGIDIPALIVERITPIHSPEK